MTEKEVSIDTIAAVVENAVEITEPEIAEEEAKSKKKESLPENTVVVDDERASQLIHSAYLRPSPEVYDNIVLKLLDEYNEKYANVVMRELWKALKTGGSIFIQPTFTSLPPVRPQRSRVEGYVKYTK